MNELACGTLTEDADAEAMAEILSLCFSTSIEDARSWVDRGRRENARLLRCGSRVAGGLFRIPMAQWYGGRSVPMIGIGAVGVDPGDRAGGGATVLMREVVREMRREGVPLSTLYPATLPLYRRAGYELAGAHFAIRLSPARVQTADRDLALRRAVEADDPEIERLHREHGREHPGNVDRSPLYWTFVRDASKRPVHVFVVEGDGGLVGYVYYVSATSKGNHADLWLRDVVARSPAAARRLLTFFRDHKTLVDSVRWRGSPADPLMLQAREGGHDVRLQDVWMLRIVHLPHALAGRGYPAGLEAEVHLDAADDVCPENAGRWILRVANGRAEATRGGEGRVRLDLRSLASLYTGYASAVQLRTGAGLDANDEDAATLDAIFAGPMPWMQDGF